METNVGKSILFTSISTIIQAVFTLLFWLIVASSAGAEAMGLTNVIISFITIIVTIDVLNTHLGMKRYLGIAKSSGDLGMFKLVVVVTIGFVSTTVLISAVLIALPTLQIMDMVGVDRQYTWIVIAIIPAFAFNILFPEVLIAARQTKNLAMALLIGSLVRFPILFGSIYILNATVSLGTLIAYSSSFFLTSALSFFYLRKTFFHVRIRFTNNLRSEIQKILEAGLASWIPTMVSVFGSQLGIIAVYVAEGAAEAGKFYLPLTIFGVALFIVNSINRVSHPLIAGMSSEDEQTRFVSYSLKIGFIFTMPLAITLLFFGGKFLALIGSDFSSAGSTLTILMIALPLAIVSEIVYYFAYGKGDKRAVLYLGLAGNIPRIALYFALVPLFGTNGAALGYLVGAITQLVFSIKIAYKYSITMQYKSYALTVLIPLALGAFTWLINLHFIIATAILLVGSLLVYIKLHLFTDVELRSFLFTSLPTAAAKRIYPVMSKVMHRIS